MIPTHTMFAASRINLIIFGPAYLATTVSTFRHKSAHFVPISIPKSYSWPSISCEKTNSDAWSFQTRSFHPIWYGNTYSRLRFLLSDSRYDLGNWHPFRYVRIGEDLIQQEKGLLLLLGHLVAPSLMCAIRRVVENI